MTNDNNKIKNLVDFSDEDPTSEFKIPDFAEPLEAGANAPSEIDERTFDVDEFAAGDDASAETVAALKASNRKQAALIEELHFELEKSRCRVNGLEREVDAREEITANISQELKELTERLAVTQTELEERRNEISYLQLSVKEAADAAADQMARSERKPAETDKDIEYYVKRIEEQSGLIASNTQEMRDLREQITRTEKYADALRDRLQSESHVSGDALSKQSLLEKKIHGLEERLKAANEALAEQKNKSKSLAEENKKMSTEFETEIRQIRFELGSAQETISNQGSINEELASDLIDNREFRHALESQLGELEEKYEQDVQKLHRKLRKARQEADEFDRKMRAKDKAISALMGELANYSGGEIDVGDVGAVADNAAGNHIRQVTSHDVKNGDPKSRVARLLIGNRDGKELRFPLFKDRLTIGRTSNNDIQLNVQYISRRHAVIVTDNERTRVVDWGSKNGVFVNQKRIAEKFLENGDVVTIGTTKFTYEERLMR